jgi:hypothetical protein
MALKEDMVMMRAGKMIMTINGEMLLMDMDVVTTDGIKVRTDGTIITPDGKTSMMIEDQAMIIDGVKTRTEEK